jgi:glyoxylase-like metal-dependent hydrolase (beta-lactamase superfamily II)
MKIDVLTSGIWQLSSVILSDAGETLVVDPGYFPRELEDVRRCSRERGRARGVIFTHGHWDHVVGWSTFPEATVWGSVSLADAVKRGTDVARTNLGDVHDFDGRWYVERRIEWPASVAPVGEGHTLAVGRETLRALLLPGHSADGLGLITGGTLLCGDYLSPLEIPFVDDIPDYRATLKRMLGLLGAEIAEVIPGHGPRLSAAQAGEIARADLVYLDALERCAEKGDDAGAAAIVFPRAGSVPGMRDHHLENWKKCLRARQVASGVAG